jgi:predicted Zn-dependent protease with MMP-like domain
MADLASDTLSWRPAKPPSLAEFEILAGEIFRRLPKKYRDLWADVVIQIHDDFSKTVSRSGSSPRRTFLGSCWSKGVMP